MNDDAGGRRQMLPRKRLDGGGCHSAIPLDVLLEIVRRPEIVVVQVQPIGDAAKAAEALQTTADRRFDGVPRAFHFAGGRSERPHRAELFIDRSFQLLRCVSRPGGRLDLEHRAE